MFSISTLAGLPLAWVIVSLLMVFRIVFIVSLVVRELLILASNDDEVSIFVWHARVACPRRGHGGIFGNLDLVEVSMIFWNVVRSSFDR